VVVLADGSTVGASASSAAPALQALDAAGAPSWLLPLGVVPGASAASYVSSVSACGASSTVLLAVVLVGMVATIWWLSRFLRQLATRVTRWGSTYLQRS
jgi:hypothetical protein